MDETFELLIEEFLKSNIGVSEHFLAFPLANDLKNNLLTLYNQNELMPGKLGNTENVMVDSAVRSDIIYWLDRKHELACEDAFFDLMESFIKYLNISCYAGITGCEFHYSVYEPGCFYKKHLDQFKNNSARKYSTVSYLNTDWQKKDGGELMIYQDGSSQLISPSQGKTVFFKSDELEHEVLVTQKRRLSIAGWLKCQ